VEGSDILFWDNDYNVVLLSNLAIAIAIFTSLRWFSGIISHINPTKELLKKDNPAFGISLSAAVFAVTVVLSGAIYGDPIYAMEDSVIAVGLYGVTGVILLAVARFIFDKLALPNISIRDEIVKGNVSAAIVDAGNVIASAIIIRTMMVWVDANTIDGIKVVLIGFLMSQILLTITTYFRTQTFTKKLGKTYQEHFTEGNSSAALRFAGRKIGTAFAITAASNVLFFENYAVQDLLLQWALISIAMILALSILSFIAKKVILFHVDTDSEVIRQHNIAIGVVQCVIYISLGLLLSELLA
jgi:uncharacterized membrane protein YjfL (UPF0719 family)